MAGKDDAGGIPVALPALLLMAIAAISYRFLPTPLDPLRPASTATSVSVVGEQTIPARLWQDPIQAVADDAKLRAGNTGAPKELPGDSVTALLTQVQDRLEASEAPVAILAVTVPAGSDAADTENRVRSRYAVVSALGRAGYAPRFGEFLGVVRVPWAINGGDYDTVLSGARSTAAAPNLLSIPYEWFRIDATTSPGQQVEARPAYVLVLWVNEDAIQDYPLTRLAQLREQFLPGNQTPSDRRIDPDRILLKVLGPSTSTTLRSLAKDPLLMRETDATPSQSIGRPATRPEAVARVDALRKCLRDIDFFSSRATAANAFYRRERGLAGHLAIPFSADGTWSLRAEASPGTSRPSDESTIQVHRCGGTDDDLAKALFDELSLRQVDPAANRKQRIAIVSEWDSFYGRALPLTMQAVLGERIDGDHTKPLADRIGQAIDNDLRGSNSNQTLSRYSYLRGLDGLVASSSPSPSNAKVAGAADARVTPDKDIVRPDGTRQLDYVRRLAAQIARDDEERTAHGEGSIRAIGVLGSDAYDKLLVIRALRATFPNAVFFTTDLDNRLLDARELPWTRNLIVASTFGLTLAERFQGSIPPFRDSYQTALFRSTLLAIGWDVTDDRNALGSITTPPTPRIFEVGRLSAVDLTPTHDPGSLHPQPYHYGSYGPWQLLMLGSKLCGIAVFGTALLFVTSRSAVRLFFVGPPPGLSPALCNIDAAELRKLKGLVMVSFVAVLLFATTIVIDHFRGGGEPFILDEGISVWPAESLRLAAMLVGLWCLVVSHYALLRNDHVLFERYVDAPLARVANKLAAPAFVPILPTIRPLKPHAVARIRGFEGQPPADDVIALWQQYRYYGKRGSTTGRILLRAILYFAIGLLMIKLFWEPSSPARGPVSFFVDSLMVFGAVTSLILVTFYVADVTRQCEEFGRKLAGDVVPWPQPIAAHFAAKCGYDVADVGDWLDVKLIAGRTEAVVGLVVIPFVLLTLMIASRMPLFDRWTWPTGVLAVMLLNVAYATNSAVSLRRTAERAREDALRNIRGRNVHADAAQASRRKALIDELEALSTGAFRPWRRHPLIAALLIPTGSVGTWAIIEFLTSAQ